MLIATAAFHASGYSSIASQIESSSAPSFLKRAMPTLWLFFAWHLLVLAVGSIFALRLGRAAGPVLLACAVVVVGDFCWVFSIAGLFAGDVLLLIASLFLFVGGWLARSASTEAPPL